MWNNVFDYGFSRWIRGGVFEYCTNVRKLQDSKAKTLKLIKILKFLVQSVK